MTPFSIFAKMASNVVGLYLRRCPVERGKYRLRSLAASTFLLSSTDRGHWVRISGVSGFEWKILYKLPKEPHTFATFVKMLRPGMTVIDAGANIGYYSLAAASVVGPNGRVHAFEPSSEVAARLADNSRMNGLSEIIHVSKSALGDITGLVELHLSADDSEGNCIFSSASSSTSESVPMITLDDYVSQLHMTGVDIIKVDVEGAELKLLGGARRLLTCDECPAIIMEINPAALQLAGTSSAELNDELTRVGYECYCLERLTDDDVPVLNVLAMKPCHWERFPLLDKEHFDSLSASLHFGA